MIGRRSPDEAQSFDDALTTGRAPRDEHIADLVRFAEDLCQAATVEPTAIFRSSLRSQLMAEAATVLVPMPTRPRLVVADRPAAGSGRRRVARVTAGLVASAGVVGIVASSASAVPGEVLYPVKRSVESVELQLHRSDASRGSFQLAQASERLAEVRRLTADGSSSSLIAESLDDFASSAADGSSSLFTDYSVSGEEKSIRQVNEFAAESSVDLSSLSSQLPESVSDSLAAASAAVTDLASEASTLCAACDPADVRALVSSVEELTRSTASAGAPKPAKVSPSSPAGKLAKTTAPSPNASKTPAESPAPAPSPVAPASPSSTPLLGAVTDPLLGGLLGDEEQTGLVPGLLGGLLGTKPKP